MVTALPPQHKGRYLVRVGLHTVRPNQRKRGKRRNHNGGSFRRAAKPLTTNSGFTATATVQRQTLVDLDPSKRAIGVGTWFFNPLGIKLRKGLRLWEALLAVGGLTTLVQALLQYHTNVDGDTVTVSMTLARGCAVSAVFAAYLRFRFSFPLVLAIVVGTPLWIAWKLGLDAAITYLYI